MSPQPCARSLDRPTGRASEPDRTQATVAIRKHGKRAAVDTQAAATTRARENSGPA